MTQSSDELFGDPELAKLVEEAIDAETKEMEKETQILTSTKVPLKHLKVRDNTNFGPDELKARFGQRIPTEQTKEMHAAVHSVVTDLASVLDRILPNGRAKFQALVELEKVLMWADVSIGDMEPLSDG